MNRCAFLKSVAAVALAVGLAPWALAQSRSGKDEAKALVEAAVAHVKAVGAEQAYADFTNDKARWTRRDLYVFAFDMKGNTLAHGGNSKLVGKNLTEMRDLEGRSGVIEMARIAATAGTGWYDYEFVNPVTKEVAPKSSYVSKLPGSDAYVGAGVYR